MMTLCDMQHVVSMLNSLNVVFCTVPGLWAVACLLLSIIGHMTIRFYYLLDQDLMKGSKLQHKLA